MDRSNLGARISANSAYWISVINGYTPRKLGLLDKRIYAEKQARYIATYKARTDVKRDIMVSLYGGTPLTATGKRLCGETNDVYKAIHLALDLRYTEHGDFSHLTGRGL